MHKRGVVLNLLMTLGFLWLFLIPGNRLLALSCNLSDSQAAAVKEHLPWGLPSDGQLLFRDGYILSHNNWLKIPNWVAYKQDKVTAKMKRTSKIAALKLDSNYRLKLDSYKKALTGIYRMMWRRF